MSEFFKRFALAWRCYWCVMFKGSIVYNVHIKMDHGGTVSPHSKRLIMANVTYVNALILAAPQEHKS